MHILRIQSGEKIKRIGVKDLKILVNAGLAEFKIEEGKSIDIDGLKKAVKDGGFTSREILITLKGKIEEFSGRMNLRIGDDSFILKYNEILKEIITSEKDQEKIVTVTGLVQEEKIEGHGLHPYALEIRDFKVE